MLILHFPSPPPMEGRKAFSLYQFDSPSFLLLDYKPPKDRKKFLFLSYVFIIYSFIYKRKF